MVLSSTGEKHKDSDQRHCHYRNAAFRAEYEPPHRRPTHVLPLVDRLAQSDPPASTTGATSQDARTPTGRAWPAPCIIIALGGRSDISTNT
jgi:hypothetical protein